MADLEVSKLNVRQRERTGDLDELVESIRLWGLLQPIVVKAKGDRYEVLIGQRRFLAAKQLNWTEIDAKVVPDSTTELDARIMSFAENAQRRDLTPRDKSEACAFLLSKLGSIHDVSQQLGVSEQTVRKWVGYAAVPEQIKRLVEEGRITRPTATRISESVGDETRAVEIARRMADLAPAGQERDRILDAVEEYGNRPPDVIFRRAEEQKVRRVIQFDLPSRWVDVIERAEAQLAKEASDIAREATVEWLERFLSVAHSLD